ncbi:MAG: antibiotic biosynthesis monooxygenase [Alphaproteobacteria bacterium HGW-Alphaproteobacteria-6]|jgi:quinol monooxygenase YgiN|nr:MAG: antibiotic biosynthesis monooxygenase [Alphaproteobacteria bacterium HGW-Alphaproteobacteria-6]
MSVVVLLHLKAKPDSFETLKATLAAILPDTRAFEGCLGICACADAEDNAMLVYERWQTKADQEAYIGWRAGRGDLDKLATLLRAAPVFETREDVFA